MKKIVGLILGIIPKLLIVLFAAMFLLIGYNHLNPEKAANSPITRTAITIENNAYKKIESAVPATKQVPEARRQIAKSVKTAGSNAITNLKKGSIDPKSVANQNLFESNQKIK